MRIYVVGWAPSIGADGESEASSGGFTWYATWREAAAGLIGHFVEEDTYLDEYGTVDGHVLENHDGFDYRLTAIDVPSAVWGSGESPADIHDRNERVTAWLDEDRELWEPPQPEYEDERCEECGSYIPVIGDESIANKHHKKSCSLYDPDRI